MSWDEVGRILPDSTPGSFIWRVEDFFSHPQHRDDYWIESPRFSALGTEWYLCTCPSVNVNCSSRTRLNLFMCPSVVAQFDFGLRGKDDAEPIACRGETTDIDGRLGPVELPVNWRQYKEKFAPGGVLSVFCRLRDSGAPSATPGNNISTQTENFGQQPQNSVDEPSKSCSSPENDTGTQSKDIGQVPEDGVDGPSKSCCSPGALKVLEHLKELLSTEEGCDVTLKVQNQEFKAHKALLIARSSVFRAMFRHDMTEKLGNEVHITDCAPDAFRIFLSHVYTGHAEGLSMSNAFDVFFVANKYDAAQLKIQCKDCIARNITVEYICKVLAFSLLHDDSVLLEMASEFFTKHFNQIVLTNQWQCFLRDHTTAANELLVRLSKCCYVPPE